jgi:putative transposase
MNDDDRHRFLTFLEGSLEIYQVMLHAYVMMTNHFHLLIQTKKANCSEFMRHFNICYTGWFNWRHHRTGNLYQGRYKAFLVDADNYLLEVSRYLHLNTVRVEKMRSLGYQEQWHYAKGYQWSSLPGYADERRKNRFVEYGMVLSMAGSRREYCGFVRDGLKRGLGNPFKRVKSRFILGDDEFVASAKRYLNRVSLREQPAYRALQYPALTPARVLRIVTQTCGIDEELLKERHRHGVMRGMVAELLYKYSDVTQAQIGQLLGGVDYISVHQLRKRLKIKLEDNKELSGQFKELEEKVKAEMYNVKGVLPKS